MPEQHPPLTTFERSYISADQFCATACEQVQEHLALVLEEGRDSSAYAYQNAYLQKRPDGRYPFVFLSGVNICMILEPWIDNRRAKAYEMKRRRTAIFPFQFHIVQGTTLTTVCALGIHIITEMDESGAPWEKWQLGIYAQKDLWQGNLPGLTALTLRVKGVHGQNIYTTTFHSTWTGHGLNEVNDALQRTIITVQKWRDTVYFYVP